jgi:hypothetical protein
MGGRKGPKPQSGLSEQELVFIKAYLKCGTYTGAALAAGFSDTQARAKGHLMAKRKPVAAAIAAAQTAVAKETKYDLLEAVKQMDLDMAQARKDKQLSALAKMHELKMKAHGLLIERVDLRQNGFNVNILGLDGERREVHVNGVLPALAAPVLALTAPSDDDDGAGLID